METVSAWDGNNAVALFGESDILNYGSATYGQTVTAPSNVAAVTSFTFYMNVPSTTRFRGYVYEWDGTKATGKPLYQSDVRGTAGSGSFEAVTFTGNIPVTPGVQYVLFASTLGAEGSGSGTWGSVNDTYAGGNFKFSQTNDFNALTNEDWGNLPSVDLAFEAKFSQAGADLSVATSCTSNTLVWHALDCRITVTSSGTIGLPR